MCESSRSLLVIVGVLAIVAGTVGDVQSAEHHVGPLGSDTTGDGSFLNPWRHIGFAESQAIAGDTIWVMDDDDESTDDYVESVFIDIPITVEAYDDDGTRPQIKAFSYGHYVIRVHESNVTLRRLDVYGATGSDDFGIQIDKRSGISSVVIDNVIVDDCRAGWDATHTNFHGIYVRYLLNGQITNSTFSNNSSRGILVSNSSAHTPNHVITGNTASNNTAYGIELIYASGNTVSGNTFDGNGQGGMWLSNADGNTITDNTMRNSTMRSGIIVANDSAGNTLTGNVSTGNVEYGVKVDDSSANVLYENEFDGLLGSVESINSATNVWVSPSPQFYVYLGQSYTATIGNNYHDYLGSDVDNDGIGDTEQTLPGSEPADTAPLYDGLASYTFGAEIFSDDFESGDTTAWIDM